jgi:hypothetical protein
LTKGEILQWKAFVQQHYHYNNNQKTNCAISIAGSLRNTGLSSPFVIDLELFNCDRVHRHASGDLQDPDMGHKGRQLLAARFPEEI